MRFEDLSNAERRSIFNRGTERYDYLTDPEKMIYDIMKENQLMGVPNYPLRKAEGGEVPSKSGVIRIEINLDGITGNEGYDHEEEEHASCPAATQNEEINAENKAIAVDDYAYGEATKTWENKNAKCATCEYYNMSQEILDCIDDGLSFPEDLPVGYCEKLHFVCAAENICNMWELGAPMIDRNPSDDGNSRDIM
jgi:hypothetical protein